MLDTIFSIKFVLFVWSIFLQSNSVKHAVQNTVCVTWEPLANRNLNAKFREKDVRTFQSSIRFKLIAKNWQFVKPFWSILHRFFLPKFLTPKIGLYTREAADNGKSKYLSSWRVFFYFGSGQSIATYKGIGKELGGFPMFVVHTDNRLPSPAAQVFISSNYSNIVESGPSYDQSRTIVKYVTCIGNASSSPKALCLLVPRVGLWLISFC